MELNQFVAKTLKMICQGVHQAQTEGENFGAIINDAPESMRSEIGVYGSHGTILQNIEFDVAVTAEDTSKGEGKVSVMGIGLGGGLSSKDSITSRVKFKVPVSLPSKAE